MASSEFGLLIRGPVEGRHPVEMGHLSFAATIRGESPPEAGDEVGGGQGGEADLHPYRQQSGVVREAVLGAERRADKTPAVRREEKISVRPKDVGG